MCSVNRKFIESFCSISSAGRNWGVAFSNWRWFLSLTTHFPQRFNKNWASDPSFSFPRKGDKRGMGYVIPKDILRSIPERIPACGFNEPRCWGGRNWSRALANSFSQPGFYPVAVMPPSLEVPVAQFPACSEIRSSSVLTPCKLLKADRYTSLDAFLIYLYVIPFKKPPWMCPAWVVIFHNSLSIAMAGLL